MKLIFYFYGDDSEEPEETHEAIMPEYPVGKLLDDLWWDDEQIEYDFSDLLLEVEFDYGTIDQFGEEFQSCEIAPENRKIVLNKILEIIRARGAVINEWTKTE